MLPRKFANALLLAVGALLSACGGGGGGGGDAGAGSGGGGGSGGSGGGGGGGGGSQGASFSLSSTTVSFSAAQGGSTPAPQVVNVTIDSGTIFISTLQTGSAFGQSFALTGPTTGQITVTPGVTGNAGSFAGSITVNGCSNATGPCNHVPGSPKTISVSYNVAGLSSAPGQVAFFATTGGGNPPAKSVMLAVSGGSVSWTSSIVHSPSGSWLSVGPSSGLLNASTPSQPVSFNVNTAGLTAGVYNATATFTDGGALTASVAVILTVSDPSVDFVSPYVVPTGPGDVIIRGHGFARLDNNTLSVQFGSAPATASIVSDTEIQATVPGTLTAGSYAISVSDGVPTTIASRAALKLVVINPPAFAAASMARPASSSAPFNLTYDAERQALLLIDRDHNRIERYAFSGTWAAAVTATFGSGAGNHSIALSPDGMRLIKTGPHSFLYRIDPATVTELSHDDVTPFLGAGTLNFIAFANDGGAIGNSSVANGVTLYRYDMLSRVFTPLSSQLHMLNRQIFASGDGSKLMLPTIDNSASDKQLYTFNSSDGTLAQRPPTTCGFEPVRVNRNATTVIVASTAPCATAAITVYDGAFTAIGSLPNGANGWVLSPDGRYAYAYYPASSTVRKFDVAGPGIVEVGTATAVPTPGTSLTEMAISPDGGTLFLAGTANVIIQPAP